MEISLKGIVVIVGNYGSGKTEVAINLAVNGNRSGLDVRIADLDLVNPYFRTREARKALEALGITVVLPPQEYMQADLPILSPTIAGMIRQPDGLTLLDVGGDDAGATVLAALGDAFSGIDVQMLQVVNPLRPQTATVEGCLKIKDEIEAAAKLTVTGLIGNANLIDETGAQEIYAGHDFLQQVSAASGLPLAFITITQELLGVIEVERFACPVLPIARQLVPPWKVAADFGAGLEIPEPVVSLAVEPKQIQDRDKLLLSLEKLQWEDPTFRVREDEDTGQTVLTGMGELHLEVLLRRLADDFNVAVNAGQPQVVYRESVSAEASHREVFEREIDGKLQRGEVSLRVAPRERGAGLEIELPSPETSILSVEVLAALDETLRMAIQAGVQIGYPMVDMSVVVGQVPIEPGVTTALGVRAAAQRALMLAVRAAKPILLEPVMALEITLPNEFSGKVLGTLQQKSGRIEGMESRDVVDLIRAHVPLSEMFGYMTELRSATQGRGSFTMEFSHYDNAPSAVLERFGLR